MICENDCEICGAEGKVRENGLVMCQTCALLAEMEPEESDFFNTRAKDRDPEPAGSSDRDEWKHQAAEWQRLK